MHHRGLLSDDNFVDGTLYGSKSDEMLSASSAQGPGQVSSSSTKVKVIKRGFSTEADSLLDYIDGIYDALDKQYLKSFVFAIYLDEENPNNLVEAYTFTISYQTIADTDIIAPVMSLATSISQMDLVDAEDPVAAAAVNGRVPTLGEVKRSVRLLVKRLISVCQQLDPLPDRRFATFKLHYNDKTPQDYEPPNFVAGDPEKDRFYFSTHGVSQPPERFSIGGVGTGQHGVQIEIASICSFLPSPEDNNAPFTGHTVTSNPRSDFVVKEAKRKADNRAQLEDAERRRVVWDAEPFGNTEREKEAANTPLGIRRKDGIDSIAGVVRHTGGAHAVPGLDEAVLTETETGGTSTQVLETQATVIIPSGQQTPRTTQANMDVDMAQPEEIGYEDTQIREEAQPTALDPTQQGTQTEAQMRITLKATDPTILFSKEVCCDCNVMDSAHETFICQGVCGRRVHAWCMGSVNSQGVLTPLMLKNRFHNANEAENSPYSICLNCTMKEQDWYQLLEQRDVLRLTEAFVGLAQYRRALKLIYLHGFPGNSHALGKLIGCARQDANRILNRLEGEGFIESQTVESDELGILSTMAATKSRRGRKPTKKKPGKPILVLIKTSAVETNLNRYFMPRGEVVQELFRRFRDEHIQPSRLKKGPVVTSVLNDRSGNVLVPSSSINLPSQEILANGNSGLPSKTVCAESDTQTQEETQMVIDREPISNIPPPSPPTSCSGSKRKGSARSSFGRGKRLKVSLANTRVELDMYEAYE
ncbi:Meiosis-specific protein HOP1 OS=Saccharomyces cerevisiae (strain ATCC 204508 / S288c) GN=HOP1 PE=1 SV=2 [Rhizoctonia solani AG-1 IB]|uniref:Meiosis-specific protein HOP1 n=1 Tax=Thanatephorus cucumeris (strain AG1-IB / isolate 7/3/14) TaxID=1108050 RepID=A0A0B7FPQ2_THACB|nr:Meiosis-specific protein HOP1 OS=Saccharomyces cerevisiae (strain ATCC 204508 / S288c) GN=HOP1 PE=1 SV=2 [Rhizoctonia solani AG-1 IB]